MFWLHSRFILRPIPCLCGFCVPPYGKNRIFRSFASMLHATHALQCLSFHTEACKHLQSLCPCNIASCSTTRGSDRSLMLSTSLRKTIRSPWHPPLSTGCSRVLAFSSEHCRKASIRVKILLAPIRRPASSLDSRYASRLSFLQRFVELLAMDSWSVLLVPDLCQA